MRLLYHPTEPWFAYSGGESSTDKGAALDRIYTLVDKGWLKEALEEIDHLRAAPVSPSTGEDRLDVERLAEAHHVGCCSDSWFRLVRWRSLPTDGNGCRDYHVQTAQRTLAALTPTGDTPKEPTG